MPLYTFHLRRLDGEPITFETCELRCDGETFAKASKLLNEHLSCDHVDVWYADHPILALHREQPVIRPIEGAILAA
jgi:hypothetical protein